MRGGGEAEEYDEGLLGRVYKVEAQKRRFNLDENDYLSIRLDLIASTVSLFSSFRSLATAAGF